MSMYECGKDIQELKQRVTDLEVIIRDPESELADAFAGREVLYVGEPMTISQITADEAKADELERGDIKMDDVQPEAYYTVQWRGTFRRNGGEMSGRHKVYLDTYTNDRISVKARTSYCKNNYNPLTLRFGFLVVLRSGNPRLTRFFGVAELRLGESKNDAYKNFGITDEGRATRDGNWHMVIST